MICVECNSEYEKKDRFGKSGLLTICQDCADEQNDIQKYTGCLIWSHKTCPSLQINKNPKVTQYILGGSDLDSEHKSGSVHVEAESFIPKPHE